jgi:hypothetical protein
MPLFNHGLGAFSERKARVIKWLLERGATKEWASRLAGCNNGRPSDWGPKGRYESVSPATDDVAKVHLVDEYLRMGAALRELGIDPDRPPDFKLR